MKVKESTGSQEEKILEKNFRFDCFFPSVKYGYASKLIGNRIMLASDFWALY